AADLVRGRRELPRGEPVRLGGAVRLRDLELDRTQATELLDRLLRSGERLAVLALLVGHRGDRSEERRVGKECRARGAPPLQAEDGIRDFHVTGVQTCALPIFAADLVRGRRELPRGEPVRLGGAVRLRDLELDRTQATELLDRLLRSGERLAVLALLVGHRGD